MRVWVTLDKIDGSQSRIAGPLYLDEIDLHGMLFRLNQSDVVGITFSRADALQKLQKMQENKIRKGT